MPQQNIPSVMNNFTAGLKTEFTGLNFPSNAATDTDNCTYSLIGDVTRRGGFDFEDNFFVSTVPVVDGVTSTYVWTNAGGDGNTQVFVNQIGSILYFFLASDATTARPMSGTYFAQVNINQFATNPFVNIPALYECQYASGNGYLFVYHPYCEPFYCSLAPGRILSYNVIDLEIRDFIGLVETGLPDNSRPSILSIEHDYDLRNEGWTSGTSWVGTSTTTITIGYGSMEFNTQTGLSVQVGDQVNFTATGENPNAVAQPWMSGNVLNYSEGGTLTINITYVNPLVLGSSYASWQIANAEASHVETWNKQIGNYPSQSDVWWNYKDNTDTFNPALTLNNVTNNTGPSPKGHFLIDPFNQDRSTVSTVSGIPVVTTNVRPKTGAWFAGRTWYAGVDDSMASTSTTSFYSWTENIYFSQIIVGNNDFGSCYQTDDPTSEDLFDLLPSDGGVIQIQGCGSVYKLFPIQNGMLVFASNGVWFITGSQGIGFTANDYTVTKISKVQCISSTSFVDVQGLPFFWNEEGIYSVQNTPQGGLVVSPITVDSILSFYGDIPRESKKFVRGAYNDIDYVIQWIYKSEGSTSVKNRYEFDKVLNYNVYNKAFYPYSFTGVPKITSVNYMFNPQDEVDPAFKYLVIVPENNQLSTQYFTMADEKDDQYVDWYTYGNNVGVNYDSYFVAGYNLPGKGLFKGQPQYVFIFSRQDTNTSYKIQGIWDYANSRNSGRWSNQQVVTNGLTRFDMVYRKHRIRGHGLALQLKVSSVDGLPFDIMGWTMNETVNTGI